MSDFPIHYPAGSTPPGRTIHGCWCCDTGVMKFMGQKNANDYMVFIGSVRWKGIPWWCDQIRAHHWEELTPWPVDRIVEDFATLAEKLLVSR